MHVGDRFRVTTRVYLGELKPEEVDVEAYYGTVNAHNEIISTIRISIRRCMFWRISATATTGTAAR